MECDFIAVEVEEFVSEKVVAILCLMFVGAKAFSATETAGLIEIGHSRSE